MSLFDIGSRDHSGPATHNEDEYSFLNRSARPAAGRVRELIDRWAAGGLAGDASLVKARLKVQAYGLEGAPTWTYQDGDFELIFAAWPKSPALRGKAGVRPIGVYPSRTKWGGDSERMKRAVLRKASKYGQLETPYLVAVNVQGFIAPDRIEEMEALFGSEQFYGVMGQDEPEMIRAPDGAWVGPAGIQNRRVSGVLFARVVPWNIPTAPWCLYHNPFADRPCTHLDWKMPQGIPAHGKITWADGHTPGELLGLPPEWPGELFDD